MARIEQRTTSLMREVNWLSGDRRFPGELCLPGVACIIRIEYSPGCTPAAPGSKPGFMKTSPVGGC